MRKIVKAKLLPLLLAALPITGAWAQGQSGERRGNVTPPENVPKVIAVHEGISIAIAELQEALRTPKPQFAEKFDKLFFSKEEFSDFYQEVSGRPVDMDAYQGFLKNKEYVQSVLGDFNDKSVVLKLDKITERSGDMGITAFVADTKFTSDVANGQIRLLYLPHKETYKIVMLDH